MHALCTRHHAIRNLKHVHSPAFHGFRVWPSIRLLIDFLNYRGIPKDSHVLDVGCGWGLGGIHCAKNHHSTLTGIVIDPQVLPFLYLHAQFNDAKIHTMVE